ncbi:MAG: DedA family protein [Methylococcaceae bacterium]|nr:MAG: DedA family protein [Methylococcaceae bacterium]
MNELTPALAGLFASAFISATLAPGGSEAVLAYLALQASYSDSLLLSVATLGNTLGAVTTWLLGYAVALGWLRRHSPPQQNMLERMGRYGMPLLLFSWLPLVGDGFCLAAGWLRLPFLPCLAAMAMGKAARYAVVLWLTH